MPVDPQALRDWQRLFGLVLSDFFIGSPFTVHVERDCRSSSNSSTSRLSAKGAEPSPGRLP